MTPNQVKFQAAIDGIDAANSKDPNVEVDEGVEHPEQLLYARRMSTWLQRLAPQAPESVQLAARAQHICRWQIPRSNYPEGRAGYRAWRTELGRHHAKVTGRILHEVGYENETIETVGALLRKQRLKADPNCQLLEDVICLVFLQYYLEAFTAKHDDTKLIHILRRTWAKMSPQGQKEALKLKYAPGIQRLLEQAVDGQ